MHRPIDSWDPAAARQFVEALAPIARRWFRSEVRGLAEFPQSGGVLVVSNHSGGMMTPDVLIFAAAFYHELGYDRPLYTLGHDLLFTGPLTDWLTRIGVIPANRDTAAQALRSGGVVLVFPGGVYDAYRPTLTENVIDFNGHTGYVRTAIEAGVPIVPAVSIGGQESQLFLTRGSWLAKRLGLKRFRSDILPVRVGFPFGLVLRSTQGGLVVAGLPVLSRDGSDDRGGRAVDILIRRRPIRERHPQNVLTVPGGPAEPTGSVTLDRGNGGAVGVVAAGQADQHLIEDDVVEDLSTGNIVQLLGHSTRLRAVAFDHVGDSNAAQRTNRRINGDRAGPPRTLRHIVRVVALARVCDQIRAGQAHRGEVSFGVGHDRHRAVIGHIEPLVRVDGPGVRSLDSGREVAGGGCGGGPQPERPVDVQPGAMLRADVGDRSERVERAGGHVAGLRAHDRRFVVGGQRFCERIGIHAALVVGPYPDRRLRA